ncbi:MAG: hypothetical protein H6707_18645 [Deltaproteobacteria bacterium]|nr:hypothetical protein [Deltaproteobacteria bacterium]
MGYEYKLEVKPGVLDLGAICDSVVASTAWLRIPTSFSDGDGIGIGDSTIAPNSPWPHIADLRLEAPTEIYVLCHNQTGGLFMRALVQALRDKGHAVVIDDDV